MDVAMPDDQVLNIGVTRGPSHQQWYDRKKTLKDIFIAIM